MKKMILFDKSETDFSTRGIGILKDVVDPIVTEKINGLYDLSFFYPLDSELFSDIQIDRIVFAKTPKNYQAFRIKSLELIDELRGVNVYALHISYDLAGNFVEDTFIQNKGGDGAIKQLLSKTVVSHSFIGTSNIQTTFNSRIVRENVLNVLLGSNDNSFLSRAGGQFERDNFRINWKNRIGDNRGVKIKYKKNLTGLIFKVDSSNIITRVMPQGFDTLFLPEKYIDSVFINSYKNINITKIKFDDIKSKLVSPDEKNSIEHNDALNLLRVKAREYLNKVDKPQITADVSFVDLSQTKEYNHYKQLESIYIGDDVTVNYTDFNLDITLQMISYSYDPILDSYIFMSLGDVNDTFFKSIDSGKVALDRVEELKKELDESILEKYRQYATDLINNGFGGYTRYYTDRMLVMDTDNEETATKVWQFNKNGIGYSKTGIQGPYVYAWTIDGTFNTDFIGANSITVNKLSADVGQSLDLSSNVSINAKVDDVVSGVVSDIIIGGRNFLKNSKYLSSDFWNTWAYTSLSFESSENIDADIVKLSNFTTEKNNNLAGYYKLNDNSFHDFIFKRDKTYTISFDFINFSSVDVEVGISGFKKNRREIVRPNESKRLIFTDTKSDINYEQIVVFATDTSRDVKFTVQFLKVEEGTKATTWTPAVEDIEELNIDNKNNILSIISDNEDLKRQIEDLKDENLKLKTTISTELVQTKESFDFLFSNFQDLYDEENKLIKSKINDFTKYIRFKNGKIEIGELNSPFKSEQEKDKIRFLYKGIEVAYFSNEKLYVTDGEFLNSLILGNFGFFPRQNGNLSFKKLENRG